MQSIIIIKRVAYTLALLLLGVLNLHAQQIASVVVDANHNPIGGASVILQTPDSVFVDAGITNAKGSFLLKHHLSAYRLLIQHLAYYERVVEVSGGNLPTTIELKERSVELQGVDVLAKPPLVKLASNGAFVYNVNRLMETSPVTNALDLLDDVPGVAKQNDVYSIVGAGSTTILLNGHKSSMTADDLKALLATTSPEEVKNIEVYYNTPQQMGVRGASINVILHKKRSEQTRFSGDVYTTAYKGRKYYQVGGFHLGVTQKKWSFDFGYGLGSLNKTNRGTSYFKHRVDEEMHFVESPSSIHQDLFSHRITGRFSLDLPHKAQLVLSYDVKFTDRTIESNIPYSDNRKSMTQSQSVIAGNEAMHVANAQYEHGALTIGTDFVMYNYHTDQNLATVNNDIANDLQGNNKQHVRKGSLYINHHSPLHGGTLNYGAEGDITTSNNSFWNLWTSPLERNLDDDKNNSHQHETSVESFVNWNRAWGTGTTLTMGVTAQYFHAALTSNGVRQTLWDNVYFFPSLNLMHKFNKGRSMVLTLSTNRSYPTYYQTSESKRYHNTYRVDVNNPALKPSTTYEAHLNHVWGGQYILGAYAVLTPDCVMHYVYAKPDELQVVNGLCNYKRYNRAGLMAVVPHEWNKRHTTRLTLDGSYNEQEGSFAEGDVYFHRSFFSGACNLTHSVRMLADKSLLLQVGATYQTANKQNIANEPERWNTIAAVAWNPTHSNWHFTLKANDLLNTNPVTVRTLWGNQENWYSSHSDVRAVNLNIRYVFNAFKAKKVRQVDTSRMMAMATDTQVVHKD